MPTNTLLSDIPRRCGRCSLVWLFRCFFSWCSMKTAAPKKGRHSYGSTRTRPRLSSGGRACIKAETRTATVRFPLPLLDVLQLPGSDGVRTFLSKATFATTKPKAVMASRKRRPRRRLSITTLRSSFYVPGAISSGSKFGWTHTVNCVDMARDVLDGIWKRSQQISRIERDKCGNTNPSEARARDNPHGRRDWLESIISPGKGLRT